MHDLVLYHRILYKLPELIYFPRHSSRTPSSSPPISPFPLKPTPLCLCPTLFAIAQLSLPWPGPAPSSTACSRSRDRWRVFTVRTTPLQDFSCRDLTQIRNKSAYFMGCINKRKVTPYILHP